MSCLLHLLRRFARTSLLAINVNAGGLSLFSVRTARWVQSKADWRLDGARASKCQYAIDYANGIVGAVLGIRAGL